MSSPIEKLTVRQLVQVLKHARGGNIGFDPFRDPRTSTRASLLKFLLETHTNEQIIAGISSLDTSKQSEESEVVTAAIKAENDVSTVPSPSNNGYQSCVKCGASLKSYYLKEGMCNGCRNPASIVEAQIAPVKEYGSLTGDPARELAVLLRRLAAENSKPTLDAVAVQKMINVSLEQYHEALQIGLSSCAEAFKAMYPSRWKP